MKFWKLRLLTALAFFTITTMVVYSACQVDTCGTVLCQNGGACVDGYCSCPSGYEGTECQVLTYTKFVGIYTGSTTCNQNSTVLDTAVIFYPNNGLLNLGIALFSHRTDSLWNRNDTLWGSINNNQIIVNDYYAPRFSRHVVVTYYASPDRINIFDQQIHLTGNGIIDTNNNVCTFYGLKQ
jgi:hypothetical protein